MKFIWSMVLTLCLSATVAHAAYEVGDVVTDFTWLESNGGAPVENSVHGIIDSGKVCILTFAATW